VTAYLLDTNHLGAALDDNSIVYERVVAARREGSRVGTCYPVLCELAVGLEQTARRDQNWKALRVFLKQIRIWPIDLRTVRLYGELYQELRSIGRVLSQVDVMVAALSCRMRLTVLTTDGDFEAIGGLRTENWLVR